MSTAFLLLSVAPSGLSPAAPLATEVRTGLLVTVGDVTDTTAMLWVRGDGTVPVIAWYRPEGTTQTTEVGITLEPRADFTGRALLSGLTPGARYAYDIAQGSDRIHGSFGTAPGPHANASARVMWSGDLGSSNNCRDVEDGYRIFHAMTHRHPDLFLFVGDTIYADHTCGTTPHAPGASFVAETLGDFHAKHRYNRADRVVQRFFRTTPVEAIWDDHEVRNNFAGPTEPLMPVGRRAFLDYWPTRGAPDEPARLYRRVRWGRHLEMFILDTRQYRSRNDEADGATKTMLGAAQRAWLLDGLRGSDATWKVIVSSVPLGQFTGGKVADSWSASNVLGFARTGRGFTHERDTLLQALREARVHNLVVLSGDVHHGELIRHEPWPGFVVHEFLAGPLAARQGFKRFLDRSLNSRSLGSLGWANNFGEITADGDQLGVRLLDTEGAVRVSFRVGAERPVLEARRVPSRAVHSESGEIQ
jgi:alkaline phosphatase D